MTRLERIRVVNAFACGALSDRIYGGSTANAAQVACRQLGLTGGMHCNGNTAGAGAAPPAATHPEMWPDGHYGFSLDDVHCSGTEQSLAQCTDMAGAEQENCSPSEGVFLVCGTDRCPPPPPLMGGAHMGLRLTNPTAGAGYNPTGKFSTVSSHSDDMRMDLMISNGDIMMIAEGILEASLDGVTWGPVCDDYFDQDGNAAEVRVCVLSPFGHL